MDDSLNCKAFKDSYKEKETFKMKQRKARVSGKPYLVGKKKEGYKEMPGKDHLFTQVS